MTKREKVNLSNATVASIMAAVGKNAFMHTNENPIFYLTSRKY